jgi:hypothetical protein
MKYAEHGITVTISFVDEWDKSVFTDKSSICVEQDGNKVYLSAFNVRMINLLAETKFKKYWDGDL